MTDPNQPQISQEEMQAQLAQLRQADVAEVVVQAVNMLATGAQVKLGRGDARVLIDAMGAVAEACDGRVADEVVGQVRDVVSRLQMAQIQAEREAGGEAGAPPDTGGAPDPGAPQQDRPAGQPEAPPQGDDSRMTDRLWIPGREPGPG